MNSKLTMNFSIDKENHTIFVKREFAAPLPLVWKAFTRSEILDQWWAPHPWKARTKSMDFKVGGQFIAKFELSIFDRWGSLIFFTDKNEPWDGTQSGLPMPIATYVWTANIVDTAGRSLKRSGTVLLLHK